MKPKRFITLCLLIFIITSTGSLFAQEGRWEKELSGEGWELWLDQTALWYNDNIYLPPVNLSALPVNPPSCGWEELNEVERLSVAVPGTVEEHWGNRNGPQQKLAGIQRRRTQRCGR